MDRRVIAIVGCVLLLLTGAPEAQGQGEWARFRGPNAGDVPDDPALPDTWSETENVVWKTDIPGLSWSSPVVSGDHVFVTSAISAGEEPDPIPGLYDPGNESGAIPTTAEHRWMVYDIDFQIGQIRWARELHRAPPQIAKHLKNSYESETPVTDGRRVYVYFGSIGLVAALNMSRETVWRQDVGTFNTTVDLGQAASPALYGDQLFIVNDNTTGSFIAAFDKETGEELWRVSRAERGQSWSTPFIWENEVRTEIVTAATGAVLRSRRESAVGDPRYVGADGAHAVRQARSGLHQLRLSRRWTPSRVCRAGRSLRRHLAVGRGARAPGHRAAVSGREEVVGAHRVVLSAPGHLQHIGSGVRRVLLHAARPGVSAVSRRSDR